MPDILYKDIFTNNTENSKSENYMNTSKRHNNYDALRIISTIAVIFIHVNWHYFSPRAEIPSASFNYIVESVINIITRFSVPSFVMISGAFNLHNEKNKNCSFFYRKSSWKIFIPVAMAISFFFFFDIIKSVLLKRSLLPYIKSILVGSYYNLWFIYMLGGLYLLTPFIIILKSKISHKTYITISICMLLWAVLSQALSQQYAAYTIGVVFAFLGYYLIGDVILNYYNNQHKPAIYFLIAGMLFIVTFVVRFMGFSYYLYSAYTNFFSPSITLASLLIFAGIKETTIQKDLSWLSEKTFYIYVFHTIVYTIGLKIINITGSNQSEIVQILIVVIITFLCSLFISIVYDNFWKSRETWKNKYFSLDIWNRL